MNATSDRQTASLSVKDLCFSYGNTEVLRSVSFRAEKGQLVTVLGPNGAGKTTLFKCILGFLPDYTGSILLGGDEAKKLRPALLARRAAYIPQNRRQTFSYSVLEMVLMGTAHSVSFYRLPGSSQRSAALAALERLGIAHLKDRSFSRVSGGEQQLVLIARAIAQRARTLIMDEPSSALDFGNRETVMSLVRSLADDGYTVLLSTHDPQQALWYADRALLLKNGQVYAYDAPGTAITEESLLSLYGLRARIMETPCGRVIVPGKKTARDRTDIQEDVL